MTTVGEAKDAGGFDVYITDTLTGETIVSHEDFIVEDDDCCPDGFPHYNYEEGNFSCDCNRALFFERAKGEETERERECGNTRYAINTVTLHGKPDKKVRFYDGEHKPQGGKE